MSILDPKSINQNHLAPEVVVSEVFAPESDPFVQQLAFLPELDHELATVSISDIDFGELPEACSEFPDDPVSLDDMKAVLEHHQIGFLNSGNSCPPPARGVVCDIDVGTAKPIALRARRVRPEWLQKLFFLLKDLLRHKLICFTDSPWASPIVICLKANGIDIRLCIDYRQVNSLTKLSNFPMPMLDALLSNYAGMRWFLSLDCASGFWAVRLTKRAQLISAFICPLGLFAWTRMPFGLKNAPLIYQRMLNNALFGFISIPPGTADVDANGEPIDMFLLEPQYVDATLPGPIPTRFPDSSVSSLHTPLHHCERSSFADDVSAGSPTWAGIVALTDLILSRLRRWNISISALKSSFGKLAIKFLGHNLSRHGLRAVPKDVCISQAAFSNFVSCYAIILGMFEFLFSVYSKLLSIC